MFSTSSDLSSSSLSSEHDGKKRKSAKSVYKHIPHNQKPAHLVARRNARERRRVQAVNLAFARLRKAVPVENRSKRLSKVKTLQKAIDYIDSLLEILKEDDDQQGGATAASTPSSWVTMATPATTVASPSDLSSYSPTSTTGSFQSYADHTGLTVDHHHSHHRNDSNLNKENFADADWLHAYSYGQFSFQNNY
ncbi:Protein atonal -like protein 7 [Halotydeus destructor]|nr:Protein atonal -like protein 7 [Halotydeus destructor]